MKKVLIVLLSVILVLSFSSCEKDRSGEIIEVYEDYWKTMKLYSSVMNVLEYEADKTTHKVDTTVSGSMVEIEWLKDCLVYVGAEGEVESITKASGSIKGMHDSNREWNLTYSDIVITYKVKGDDKDREFKFSGIDKSHVVGTTQDLEFKVTINDKEYSFYQEADLNSYKFISASVNGKDVDVRLLNGYLKSSVL